MKNEFTSELSRKIGTKIKFERMKRKLSQEELAEFADLDRGTISKVERAVISPTIVTVEKIANALGMTFIDLVDVSKFDL